MSVISQVFSQVSNHVQLLLLKVGLFPCPAQKLQQRCPVHAQKGKFSPSSSTLHLQTFLQDSCVASVFCF